MEKEIDDYIFPIRFSDCDSRSRLRVSAFFDFMEETAILDAEKNGCGIWKLLQSIPTGWQSHI